MDYGIVMAVTPEARSEKQVQFPLDVFDYSL